MVASGPAGPRRRLGTELRKLRNGAGLHLDEVAQALGCSTSKVSRLETGKGVPKASDVRQLIRLYGRTADDERETLLQLVRDSRAEGWWTTVHGGSPAGAVLPRRSRAGTPRSRRMPPALRSFDYGILHGLLQTPEYARAVLSLQLPQHSAHEIDQLVELRKRRQEAAAPPRTRCG